MELIDEDERVARRPSAGVRRPPAVLGLHGMRSLPLIALSVGALLAAACGGTGTAARPSQSATPRSSPTPSARAVAPSPAAPCPSDPVVLAAVKDANSGSLPPDAAVAGKECVDGYVVAHLQSSSVGGALVVGRQSGGGLTQVVVGSSICDAPVVQAAPPDVKARAGCAGAAAPSPTSLVGPGGQCGTTTTAAGVEAPVVVRQGQVDCAEILQVLATYYRMLGSGQAPGNGGGGGIPVQSWTCASGPATDPGTSCTAADGRSVSVVLQ